MSRRKNKHQYPTHQTRQHAIEQQQQKELHEAQKGHIDETREEIEKSIAEESDNSSDEPGPGKKKKIRPWYVCDTNLLLSCPDIIPDFNDPSWAPPINFQPDLTDAFLIIPETVDDELNHMKDTDHSTRGITAQHVIKRLTNYLANVGRSMEEIGNLRKPVQTGWGNQTIALLPIHKEFKKAIPWAIKNEDNDSWIAITALVASLIRENSPVDGSMNSSELKKRSGLNHNVVLLTNDSDMHNKATKYNVYTKRYSFKKRPEFTGIRKVTVPAELFKKFYFEHKITNEEFEQYMPDETPLAANEYIEMTPEDDEYPRGYFADLTSNPYIHIGRFHVENGLITPLRFAKHEGVKPVNAGIAAYYDALNDDSIEVINVTGAAGTGKTYQAIYHAIKKLKAGNYTKAVLIPSRAAKNPLGALPGGQTRKMEPLVGAAKDAIRSYLASTPQFTEMRANLKKFGDTARAEDGEDQENEKGKGKKNKGDNSRRNDRGSRRSNFDFTRFDEEGYDEAGDGYSERDYDRKGKKGKKNKDTTYYPGKADKKDADDSKMSYYDRLTKEVNYLYNRYFISIPYEFAEGRSFDDCIIILDEFQRVQVDDSDTLITRPGKRSKLIVCGDIAQIHDSSPEKRLNNGLNYSRMIYFDEQIAAKINQTENMRGDISDVATKNRYRVRRAMGLI